MKANMLSPIRNNLKRVIEEKLHSRQRINQLGGAPLSGATERPRIIDLIKKGKSVSGYVPFLDAQTEIVFYNFFSINYGLRSPGNLVLSIVDKNFRVLSSAVYKIGMRTILSIKPTLDEQLQDACFCVLTLVHDRLEKNHAQHGGHLRFWGIFNDGAGFSHSMPNPLSFSTVPVFLQIIGQRLTKRVMLADRRFYPMTAKSVEHFSQTGKLITQERGDCSETFQASYGFSVIKDERDAVASCFHDSPMDRNYKSDYPLLTHIVALPPIIGVDAHLFFGECCVTGSFFKVKFFVENQKRLERTLVIDTKTSISAKSIFPEFNDFDGAARHLEIESVRGAFQERYVNVVYCSHLTGKVFDGVHSHHFARQKVGRSLKFAPFRIDNASTFDRFAYLNIYGDEFTNIKFRIRFFSENERNYERVLCAEISARKVLFLDLNNMVGDLGTSDGYFIVQLESEEQNVQANLFQAVLSKKGEVTSLAVDHLTGG